MQKIVEGTQEANDYLDRGWKIKKNWTELRSEIKTMSCGYVLHYQVSYFLMERIVKNHVSIEKKEEDE